MRHRCVSVGIVLLAIACSDGDSETSLSELAVLAQWSVDAVPVLTLVGGVVNGDSVHFYRIRAAEFTSSGHIVVALGNGADRSILVFDSVGALTAAVGRSGAGPGEFGYIADLFVSDSQFAAWDLSTRRLTRFTTGGRILGELSLASRSGDRIVAVLDSLTFVTAPSAISVRAGARRNYSVRSETHTVAQIIGPTEPSDGLVSINYTHRGGNARTSTSLPPDCLPRLFDGRLGDRLLVADAAAGEVTLYDVEGRQTLLHSSRVRAAVTADAARAIRAQIEGMERRLNQPQLGPDGMHRLSDVRFPPNAADSVLRLVGGDVGDPLRSVWSGLLIDTSGRVWLREAKCHAGDEDQTWNVIGSDGHAIATFVAPAQVRLHAVHRDRVLAQARDSLDVEYLVVLRIQVLSERSLTN